MIYKIAWRNIWRQKVRSLVIMIAIIVGLSGLLFLISFMNGFTRTYLENAIKYEYSHIQIHHKDFMKDQEVKYNIKKGEEIASLLVETPNIQAATYRTILNGMISSSKSSTGIEIWGIDTTLENEVTGFSSLIEDGDFLASVKRNPIILGEKLAEKLKVDLRSKVVISFQNQNNVIISDAFRVAGIFKGKSPVLNESTVLVKADDLMESLNGELVVNEIAVLLENENEIDKTVKFIKEGLADDYEVEKWNEMAPELSLMIEQSSVNIIIMVVIFMIALIFGIINTMLMAVLERVKELGMLMAIGMNKLRVFSMIVSETFYLGLAAAPIGLLIGHLIVKYYAANGIDLSSFADGLNEVGYDSIIYPVASTSGYIILAVGIFITTLLAAIYPAIKAIRLKPVEAIRKI